MAYARLMQPSYFHRPYRPWHAYCEWLVGNNHSHALNGPYKRRIIVTGPFFERSSVKKLLAVQKLQPLCES